MSMFIAGNIDSVDSRKKKKKNTIHYVRTSIVPDFHEFLRLRDVT